jgi:hypothetical protein
VTNSKLGLPIFKELLNQLWHTRLLLGNKHSMDAVTHLLRNTRIGELKETAKSVSSSWTGAWRSVCVRRVLRLAGSIGVFRGFPWSRS